MRVRLDKDKAVVRFENILERGMFYELMQSAHEEGEINITRFKAEVVFHPLFKGQYADVKDDKSRRNEKEVRE